MYNDKHDDNSGVVNSIGCFMMSWGFINAKKAGEGQVGCEPELLLWTENYLGHFLEKLQKNVEKLQQIASATEGRASRAPFAGNFLYFFHIFCNFSEKRPR